MRIPIFAVVLLALTLPGCAPRVGSDRWCEKQRDKPKGEWTLDETGDYAKYCVLGMSDESFCKKLERKPKGDWTANEAAEYAKSCLIDRTD
ncbi:MAG: DUF3012 domain-containing protein [Myxococcota bacterium]|nr:DUF3012 domain-containing protein [Myxococcota bacterium]